MQKNDLVMIAQFLLFNMANWIEFCKEHELSEFEADRIFDELEEQSNG